MNWVARVGVVKFEVSADEEVDVNCRLQRDKSIPLITTAIYSYYETLTLLLQCGADEDLPGINTNLTDMITTVASCYWEYCYFISHLSYGDRM